MKQLTKLDKKLGLNENDFNITLSLMIADLGEYHNDVRLYAAVLETKKNKTIKEDPLDSSAHKFVRKWVLEYKQKRILEMFE